MYYWWLLHIKYIYIKQLSLFDLQCDLNSFYISKFCFCFVDYWAHSSKRNEVTTCQKWKIGDMQHSFNHSLRYMKFRCLFGNFFCGFTFCLSWLKLCKCICICNCMSLIQQNTFCLYHNPETGLKRISEKWMHIQNLHMRGFTPTNWLLWVIWTLL